MAVLALTLTGTGRSTEAAELNRQVVEVKESSLGVDDPATLSAINNLASTLADMGNLPEAIDLYRKVLEVRKKRLGPEHPQTLQSVRALAVALHERRYV
jgi:tetratricopeptide (TPR) repeat protein